jgi:hypothetical protein
LFSFGYLLFATRSEATPPLDEAAKSAPPPGAQGPSETTKEAEAYCDYVLGVAASESATMVAPTAFGSFGAVNGLINTFDANGAPATLPATVRLTAGLRYDLADLYRGLAERERARIECERYKNVSLLHAFVEANKSGTSVAALSAKIAVLDAALPHAKEVLASVQRDMDLGRATVEDLLLSELRLRELEGLRAEAQEAIDATTVAPQTPTTPIRQIMHDRERAEASVEKYEGRIRASRAWELSLRGGYDRVFGIRDQLPLFGMVTVAYNLGGLFQKTPNDRAVAGRVGWSRDQIEGIDDRVEQLMQALRATRSREEARLAQVEVLVSDLEAKAQIAGTLSAERVKGFVNYVWFELVKARAERAYLIEHLRELSRLIGNE